MKMFCTCILITIQYYFASLSIYIFVFFTQCSLRYFSLKFYIVGGTVASWLVCSTPERVLQVRVLGQDTLLSQCLSPPRCINGYRRI